MQAVFNGGCPARPKSLYLTLSESKTELQEIADSHGWAMNDINLFELVADESYLQPEPAHIESKTAQ